jgi:hypothetical protein
MKHFKNIGAMLILLLAVSCQETPAPSNGSSTNTLGWTTGGSGGSTTGFNDGGSTTGFNDGGSSTDGSTTGGSTTTTTTAGSGGGFGSGSTCYGSAADGDNSGMYPIIDYSLNLPGQVNWQPTTTATAGQLLIDQYSMAAFTTNYRLRFRVKINAQPSSCPNKPSGTVSYPYYSKLKFDVNFHTINTQTGELSAPFDTLPNQMVDVNGCSQIWTMNQPGIPGDFQNPSTAGPIYVSISNVRTDYECQYYDLENDPENYYYDFYCPAERVARSFSCWSMKLQVVNDNTDDFQ